MPAPIDDTMLISYALDGGKGGSGMDELAEATLGHKPVSFKDVAGSGQNMWGDHDDFHFVWKRMTGNFILSTRARFIGAIEPIEHIRQVGIGDTRALVSDREPTLDEADVDATARRTPLNRVVEHVRDRAFEPVGVTDDNPVLDVDRKRDSRRAPPNPLDRSLDDRAQVQFLGTDIGPVIARKLDQVSDQP